MPTPLELLCIPELKTAAAALTSNTPKTFANPTFGESIPLEVAIVTQIPNPTGQLVFLPQSWTGWTNVKAAIGAGFVAPVAGNWFILSGIDLTSGVLVSGKRYQILTFVSGDDFTNIGAASNATGVIFTATGTTPTTWTHASVLEEITANLQFNCIASDVQTALNATGWISGAGGVVVSTAPNTTLYFIVAWNNAGARAQLNGYAANLVPLSLIETGTEVDGDAQTIEIQTIRVGQNDAAFTLLTTSSAAASILVTETTTGGGGANAKYTVQITPTPYDGSFTLTVAGIESQLIPFNAPATDTNGTTGVQTYLANISVTFGTVITGRRYKIITFVAGDDFINIGGTNATGAVFVATGTTPTTWTNGSTVSPVGAGNVQATTNQSGAWLIAFQGDMANTDMGTITGDADAIDVIPYLTGSLNLDTAGVELFLGSATSVSAFLAITAIPPSASYPQELLRIPVTLNAAIIDPASEAPTPRVLYYTQAQSDARFVNLNQLLQWSFAGTGAPMNGQFTANSATVASVTSLKFRTVSINQSLLNLLSTLLPGSIIGIMSASGGLNTFSVNAAPVTSANVTTVLVTIFHGGETTLSGIYSLNFPVLGSLPYFDSDGAFRVGTGWRLLPITNGGKVQTSSDGGTTWADQTSWP